MSFFNKTYARGTEEARPLSPETGRMLDVIIALIPAAFAGIAVFGIRAALVMAVSIISSVLFEHLYSVIKKSPTTIGDLSAVITGLVLSFSLPARAPLYVPVFGSAVAIILVKLLSGGKGKNFLNPAITARAALYIAFTPSLVKFTVPARNPVDAVSCATPLRVLSQLDMSADIGEQISTLVEKGELPGLINMLFGVKAGCIGEVCAVALILGGIYLILREVIHLAFPVTYLGAFALATLVFSGFSPVYTLYSLLSGAVIFAAFFIFTEPVTGPDTLNKRLISGAVAGALTAVIRFFTPLPEGVTVCVLLMNLTLFAIREIPLLRARIAERKIAEENSESGIPNPELPEKEISPEAENEASPVGEGSPLPSEEVISSAEIPHDAENAPSPVGDDNLGVPPEETASSDSTAPAEEIPSEPENEVSPVGEGSPLPSEEVFSSAEIPSEAENAPSPVGDDNLGVPPEETDSSEESSPSAEIPPEPENEPSPVGEGSPLPSEESSHSAEIPSVPENEPSPVGDDNLGVPTEEADSSDSTAPAEEISPEAEAVPDTPVSKPVLINRLTPDTAETPEPYPIRKKKGRKAKKKQPQMPDFSEPLPEVIPEFLKREIEKQKADKGE